MEGSVSEAEMWLLKSRRSMEAATVLYRMAYYDECVSRAYYALFYCIKALFAQDGIRANEPSTMLHALGSNYVSHAKLEPCYHKGAFQVFDIRFRVEYESHGFCGIDQARFALESASAVINEIRTCLLHSIQGKVNL